MVKRRHTRILCIYCAFILIGGILPALQYVELWRSAADKSAYERRLQSSEALAFDISRLLASAPWSRPTLDDARSFLAGQGSLAEHSSASWTLPKGEKVELWSFLGKVGEARANLEFVDGRWSYVSVPPELMRVPPPRQRARRFAEAVRPLATIGWVVWFLFALTRPVNWSRRRGYVAMTAMVLVSVFATLPSWRFSYWRWVVLDDPGWRWLMLVLTAAIWWRAWPRVNRANLRACKKCGYDLFANATGVCPECGRPLEPSQRAYVTGTMT